MVWRVQLVLVIERTAGRDDLIMSLRFVEYRVNQMMESPAQRPRCHSRVQLVLAINRPAGCDDLIISLRVAEYRAYQMAESPAPRPRYRTRYVEVRLT